MAAFIDQVHDGNQAGLITITTLLPAVEQAIQTFHQAFPEISLIKKWHWQFHMPDTLQRFGFLPSCFANERKHKPIGALAQALLNQKKMRPTCWSKPLPKRSAIWTQKIFSKMVSIWFAQRKLPKKLCKLCPAWLVKNWKKPWAANVPESTMLSATRMMWWFTKQLVTWELQKSSYIFFYIELWPPWSKPGRSRNGCHTRNLPHALCLTRTWDLCPLQTSWCPSFATKAKKKPKCFCLIRFTAILAGWKKTTGAYSHCCMHVCFSFDSPLALHCLHIWLYNHNSLCGISPAQGITYHCVAFHCFFLAFEGHCIVQFLSFFHTAEDMKACTKRHYGYHVVPNKLTFFALNLLLCKKKHTGDSDFFVVQDWFFFVPGFQDSFFLQISNTKKRVSKS